MLGHIADDERPCRVAVPAVDDGAGVDRHDLSFAHAPRAGHAVDDLVVDRYAQRVAERGDAAGHADERWHAARGADHLLCDLVELERGHARPQLGREAVQDVRHQTAGHGHLLDLGVALERYPAVRGHAFQRAGWATARNSASVTASIDCSPSTVLRTPDSA